LVKIKYRAERIRSIASSSFINNAFFSHPKNRKHIVRHIQFRIFVKKLNIRQTAKKAGFNNQLDKYPFKNH
jgi:hypothetical protein